MDKREVKEEIEKENLLKASEIALWLDVYDDIFSDFDPRPFSQRSLSIDFLDEIKRASRDKASGQIELRFLIPQNLRDIRIEEQIKRRLKEHFKRHSEQLHKENKKTVGRGVSIGALGFVLMFMAVTAHYLLSSELLVTILTTLLEPAGWFLMFFGFDTAFYWSGQKQPEVDFYEKMSRAEVSFVSY